MTGFLWQKQAGGTVDATVQQYLAGEDVVLDRHLLPYDIDATAAHVAGLRRIGALAEDESELLLGGLDALADQVRGGSFVLDDRYEDGHSAIEAFLTERLGELGGKVHLGRSRNDQVLAAQRLLVRDLLDQIEQAGVRAAHACLDLARAEEQTIMPGYTHLQRAVPSTIGLWMAGFAESFIDDAWLFRMTRQWMNACPLGTAAGYGVNVPLDRTGVSEELGFDRLLINPLHAQNSRGKYELQALSACWQLLQTVRRMAWDLTLYTADEFGFVRLSDGVSTGSSIMPNKRNPDLAELLRAAPGVVAGAMNELQQVLSLPSGYHRDLQVSKGPVIRGLLHTHSTIHLVPILLASVTFDREAMGRAVDAPMCATDRAVELALGGLPFRDSYRQVAGELEAGHPSEPGAAETSVAQRCSPGACADLRLDELQDRLEALTVD